MKDQFSQSRDDPQYLCLHVSKMVSLDAKGVLMIAIASITWFNEMEPGSHGHLVTWSTQL